MTTLLDTPQISSNNWAVPAHQMLHEYAQSQEAAPLIYRQVSFLLDIESQMAEADAEHFARLGEVKKLYIFPRGLSTGQFLSEHRTIPQLLLTAAPFLKDCFGENTLLTLRTRSDESGWETLYAVAMWPGSAKDAHTALDKFDDLWWVENSRESAGRLTFTYELV